METYLEVLRNEFEGRDNSFIIKLRPFCEWDQEAFSRLVAAMKICCENQSKSQTLDRWSESQTLERWLATGFWYFPKFVRDWTSHEKFPRLYPEEYYQKAYEQLDDLAYWFFFGESPYESDKGFELM